jgi:Ni/Co efflux regulator RcnB
MKNTKVFCSQHFAEKGNSMRKFAIAFAALAAFGIAMPLTSSEKAEDAIVIKKDGDGDGDGDRDRDRDRDHDRDMHRHHKKIVVIKHRRHRDHDHDHD